MSEQKRLNEAREIGIPWKKWGPYLSERQWGTVREDYSDDGNAWDYFSHDQSLTSLPGPYGIRSLSRYHLDHPFTFPVGHHEYKVQYLPAESNTGMFGGNSNWRGPVWMPVNALIIRALLNLYQFYGDDFTVECPTGSGKQMTLFEVAQDIGRRLTGTFLRNADGKRPVYGGTAKFQSDPHWRDLILFYEYFHGDNGAGLGASHQTGWTGLVAPLLDIFGRLGAKAVLETERGRLSDRLMREQVAGEQPALPVIERDSITVVSSAT